MAPVKFDDLSKVATEVLNDDYQVSGHTFKAKQQTSWGGSVLSTQVDLFKDKNVATPAKLTWKLPVPFGCTAFCVDKLEMDKEGKFKLEATSGKNCPPGLKLNCKSDLANIGSISAGLTYTGLKNAQFKYECKVANPQDFVGEATYSHCFATAGLKFNEDICKGSAPDFGLRLNQGPYFCSILAKENFGKFNATAHYKANADLRCAAACDYSSKGPNVTVGCAYKGLYKVKVTQDQTISCSAKHSVAKGFTLLGGAQYSVPKGNFTYGLQLSIE